MSSKIIRQFPYRLRAGSTVLFCGIGVLLCALTLPLCVTVWGRALVDAIAEEAFRSIWPIVWAVAALGGVMVLGGIAGWVELSVKSLRVALAEDRIYAVTGVMPLRREVEVRFADVTALELNRYMGGMRALSIKTAGLTCLVHSTALPDAAAFDAVLAHVRTHSPVPLDEIDNRRAT